jgi:putative transposase
MQRIRSSQPVRKVRRGVSNVTGRYPSVKMGVSIQFESQHVELWGMYTMERDDDVLEYFDQPTRIQLHYHARSGRKTSPWHTPDFCVVRRDGAGFEEWKPATALDQLAIRMPERYQRHGAGGWRCPPGEAVAHALGLYYRVRTSAAYHPFYIQNLKFLQDFWTHACHVDAGQEAQVFAALSAYPGVSVAALLDAHPHLSVDVVWALRTARRLYTDLSAASLRDWDHVFLYQSEAAGHAALRQAEQMRLATPLASRLLWDGRLWAAEVEGRTGTLRPEVGAMFRLASEHFPRLVALGQITPEGPATPSPLRESAREVFAHAGPKAWEAANRRWREILAYTRGAAITVTARSIQNWMAAFRRAETASGCGYLGLLDHVARRGNRTTRVPEASRELLREYLTTHYAVPQATRAAGVYRLYREACAQQGSPPVGERTFDRERARLPSQEVTTRRRGKRAAYAAQPFYY